MAKALIPELLKKTARSEQDYPTQAEFLAEIIALAGGPRQLAARMWTEFTKEGASPMVRARFMDIVLKSLASLDKGRGQDDYGGMTDDELAAILEETLAKRREAAGGAQ